MRNTITAAFGFLVTAGCAHQGSLEPGAGNGSGDPLVCSAAAGYDFALAGGHYEGGCGASEEYEFLIGYVAGRRARSYSEARAIAQDDYNRALVDAGPNRVENYAGAAAEIRPASYENPRRAERDLKAAERRLDAAEEKLRQAQAVADAVIDGGAPMAAQRSAETVLAEGAVLSTVHAFSRTASGIRQCTDKDPSLSPYCDLAPEARIVDARTGEVCATGPGELRYLGSEMRADAEGGEARRADIYAFYREEDRTPAGAIALVSLEAGSAPEAACAGLRLGR